MDFDIARQRRGTRRNDESEENMKGKRQQLIATLERSRSKAKKAEITKDIKTIDEKLEALKATRESQSTCEYTTNLAMPLID
jgi:hypothetical protein